MWLAWFDPKLHINQAGTACSLPTQEVEASGWEWAGWGLGASLCPGMVVGKRQMQRHGNQCQSTAAVPQGTISCRPHLGIEIPDGRVLALKLSMFYFPGLQARLGWGAGVGVGAGGLPDDFTLMLQ